MQWKFCYLCGGKLKAKSEHAWECQDCGQSFYRNGQAATGIILLNEFDEILLAVRAQEPGKGMYDLPGGFVEPGESLEKAALRELTEETGITEDQLTNFAYYSSGPNEYPWGNDTVYTCDALFTAHVQKDKVALSANDDVASLQWMSLAEVDSDNIFVPAAGKAIEQLR